MVLEKEGLHFILTFLGKPSKPGFWRHLKKNKVEILVLRAQKEFLMQDDDKKRERQMNVASDAMKVAKFLWYSSRMKFFGGKKRVSREDFVSFLDFFWPQ